MGLRITRLLSSFHIFIECEIESLLVVAAKQDDLFFESGRKKRERSFDIIAFLVGSEFFEKWNGNLTKFIWLGNYCVYDARCDRVMCEI